MNTQAGLHQLSSLVGDIFRLLGDLGKFNLQELRKLRNSIFVALAAATIPVTIATSAPMIEGFASWILFVLFASAVVIGFFIWCNNRKVVMYLGGSIGLTLLAVAIGSAYDRSRDLATLVAVMTGIIVIGWLIGRRAILGTEIGTILHARKIENINLDAVIRGFDQFLVFSAGIVTTEIVVCFMGSMLPAENNLIMAMMLWPVAVGFVAYTFWSKGATWWKPICLFTLLVTLARLVVVIGWPEDAAWSSFVHLAYVPGTFIPSRVWLSQASGVLTFLLLLVMLIGAPIFVVFWRRRSSPNPSSAAPVARYTSASAAAKNENAGWIMCFGTLLAAMVTFAFVIMWYDSRGHQTMYFWAIVVGAATATYLGTRGKDSRKALMFMCLPGAFMSLMFLATIVKFRPY